MNESSMAAVAETPMRSPTHPETIAYCAGLARSLSLSDSVRKLNIFLTILIICVGLVGNSLGVFVFVQKRFRSHSSGIYLLFICLTDGLFLLMHFFEDTLRTFIDVYLNDNTYQMDPVCTRMLSASVSMAVKAPDADSFSSWMDTILRSSNITDRFDFSCRLVNFLRYYLRFLSAYFIVAFTIQRTLALRFSLSKAKFESNRLVWWIVSILFVLGAALNSWVPFVFRTVSHSERVKYCDIAKEHTQTYFFVTIAYIVTTMLLPIVLIFVCNCLIIFYILKSSEERARLSNANIIRSSTILASNARLSTIYSQPSSENQGLVPTATAGTSNNRLSLKSRYYAQKKSNSRCTEQTTSLNSPSTETSSFHSSFRASKLSSTIRMSCQCRTNTKNDSLKITRMLLFMSFSYAILNLPYFVSWSMFFYKMAILKSTDKVIRYYLFAGIPFSEIFYVLNYAIHFFIYCASGKRFRILLKNALSLKRGGR
jgi:hypothetical protein